MRTRMMNGLANWLTAWLTSWLLLTLAPASAMAQTPVERGAYLVRGPAACGACHTNPAPGSPELGGGRRFAELAYTAIGANLTPDVETGIANWSDAELVNGLRNGKRPRGSTIGPPMPIATYRHLSDDDAQAIVAYLRSLKPVVNKTARSSYRVGLPGSYGPEVGKVAAVSASDPVAYGRYLATGVAGCMECHSKPGENGAADMENGLAGGGRQIRGPDGVALAPGLTPASIGFYSDDELRRIITSGVRPDGSKLQAAMPTAYFANMSASDVSAVIAYLRSLPKR